MRNWQNGRLWWNDPDAIVLTGDLTEDEFRFHATSIFATGGMILSGDDLTTIAPERLEMLRKLTPPSAVAARYEDDVLRVGTIELQDRRFVCLLNPTDAAQTATCLLPQPHRVRDLWSGADLGRQNGRVPVQLAPHSGTVLVCTPA